MITVNALFMFGAADRIKSTYESGVKYDSRPENFIKSELSHTVMLSLGYIYRFQNHRKAVAQWMR